jgi:S1-C subfamily serine protease
LQPGDVIHEINGTPITSIAALRDALDAAKTDVALVLQVERDGKMSFQVIEVE